MARGGVDVTDMMDALVYEAPKVMTMRRVAIPECEPHEVLVRVHFAGICGSELSGYLGQSSLRTPPLVFGHELSGTIEAVGSHVDPATTPALGTAVTVNPLQSCGQCHYCAIGRQQLCARRALLGAHRPGSNAEFVAVPANAVLPIPDGMSMAEASMTEPAAFALRAVELSRVQPTATALVVGAGAIGLLLLQVLREFGVSTRLVSEHNIDRQRMAEASGAIAIPQGDRTVPEVVREHTNGLGVDVAFDAVGSTSTRRDCLESVAPAGTIVLAGLHSDETSLPLNTVVRSEITITGAFAYSPEHFRTALQWLADKRIGLHSGVVTVPLADGPVWYERLVNGDPAAKVLLVPGTQGMSS